MSMRNLSKKALIYDISITLLYSLAFYNRIYIGIIMVLFLIPIKFKLNRYKINLDNQVKDDFLLALHSINSYMMSGSTIDTAFIKIYEKMKEKDSKSLLYKDISNIVKNTELGTSLYFVIDDFGKDYEINEIKIFNDFIKTSINSGVDQKSIISKVIGTLTETIEIERKIEEIMYEKKLELDMISMSPIFLIFAINRLNEGFLNVMYNSLTGILIMTLSLSIIIGGKLIGKKVMDINV